MESALQDRNLGAKYSMMQTARLFWPKRPNQCNSELKIGLNCQPWLQEPDIRTAGCFSAENSQTARSSGQCIKLTYASASYGECSARSKSRSEQLNDANSQTVSANAA